jgi:hypothetical protein
MPEPASSHIVVNQKLSEDLADILLASAKIGTLVKERQRRRGQSLRDHEVLRRRVRWLRNEVLGGIDLREVLRSSTRNTLEHFDEYIDAAAIRATMRMVPLPAIYPLDMMVGHRDVFDMLKASRQWRHIWWLRAYIAEERVFVNCGEEISIAKLYEESLAIRDRLATGVPDPSPEFDERAASLRVITEESLPS